LQSAAGIARDTAQREHDDQVQGVLGMAGVLTDRRILAGCVALVLLAGCARTPVPARPAPAEVPAVIEEPKPVDGPTLPPEAPDGSFRTINTGLSGAETLWHLRSALNVAALACDKQTAPGLVSAYNIFLKAQSTQLSRAYADEAKARPNPRALDLHMTQLYNYFAQPPALVDFCARAKQVAAGLAAVPATDLVSFAGTAVPALDKPFQDYYARWRDYRIALAAWKAGREPTAPPEPAAAIAADAAVGGNWRIQLGAFTGRMAAERAWGQIKAKQPALDRFEPIYEDAPGGKLVRVQIGAAGQRAEAISLCATAAAAGLDCLPLSAR
jgi:hypothetical protein